VSVRRNGERLKEAQCSEIMGFLSFVHCILYTSILSCILYQLHADLQSGKVTLERPSSVQVHSQISVVQVFRPRFDVNKQKIIICMALLTCAAVILICWSHRLVNNEPVSSVSWFTSPSPPAFPCASSSSRAASNHINLSNWSMCPLRRPCSIILRAIVSAAPGVRSNNAPRPLKEMLLYIRELARTLCSITARSRTVVGPVRVLAPSTRSPSSSVDDSLSFVESAI